MLNVSGLNKKFGKKQVLEDVNFQLKMGEILAIIGPSGAGKTTILRCINGLEKEDSGTIQISGKKLQKGDIGLVFQNYNLFPHMSVMENIIEAPVNVYGLSKKDAIDKGLELLGIMGLSDKKDAYPFQLSGGQKQRVAIARACALNPKFMCLDEPTSALDPELREGIAGIVEDLAQDGMGILIITHDMDFARRVADNIIFMEAGKILKSSSKEEFFNEFGDERIRKFVSA